MRKRSKRQTRPAAIPTLVFLHTIPDAEIAVLTSVAAFRGGYASPGQFDILLDTRDLLLLGASGAKDEGVAEVARAVNDTLGEIRASWDGERFAPLNDDALNALSVLADISNDFWKRKSGSLYQAAYLHLKNWRIKQGETISENRREENRADTPGMVCG